MLLIPLWPERIELEVSDAGVADHGQHVRADDRRSPISSFARKLTRDDMPGLFDRSARTNGVGLPNYQGGWFRLKNGAKGLVFLTDSSRAVIVPTSEGYTLLASPEDPDGFLAALARLKRPLGCTAKPSPYDFRWHTPGFRNGSMLRYLAVASLAPLLLGGLLGGLTWGSRRVRFEVSREGLRIRGPYGRFIPRDAPGRRECPDREPENRSFVPRDAPDQRDRHARIRRWLVPAKGGKRALLFVTDRRRAVAIPTHLGYTLLLSPADPEGFLTALQGGTPALTV